MVMSVAPSIEIIKIVVLTTIRAYLTLKHPNQVTGVFNSAREEPPSSLSINASHFVSLQITFSFFPDENGECDDQREASTAQP
jgi:hypothetical protein